MSVCFSPDSKPTLTQQLIECVNWTNKQGMLIGRINQNTLLIQKAVFGGGLKEKRVSLAEAQSSQREPEPFIIFRRPDTARPTLKKLFFTSSAPLREIFLYFRLVSETDINIRALLYPPGKAPTTAS